MYLINPNNVGYRVEFRSGPQYPATFDDEKDPWAYCLNHTTGSGASFRMCMGGDRQKRVIGSSMLCADSGGCPKFGDSEDSNYCSTNIFLTTMFIQQVNAMVIFSAQDSTIVAIEKQYGSDSLSC